MIPTQVLRLFLSRYKSGTSLYTSVMGLSKDVHIPWIQTSKHFEYPIILVLQHDVRYGRLQFTQL